MIRLAMQNCLLPTKYPQIERTALPRPFARWFVLGLLVMGSAILTGCTTKVDDTQRTMMNSVFRPYVPDIVQGNFISSEQYAKLELGMSREQVRQILGTPLLASYFHANRWDYVFEFKRLGEKISKERRVTVFFDGDKVTKFNGDALPTEVELVAEIDNYAKNKRSFWDMVTGKNKNPVTPPLQQPEVLIPSKPSPPIPPSGPIVTPVK
jgi:outer membrane protein assembly factor BamE